MLVRTADRNARTLPTRDPFVTEINDHRPFEYSPHVAPAVIPPGRSADPLVAETQQQIAGIVREIAAEARRDQSRGAFLRLLVDRVLRAMAAEGVVVWERDPTDRGAGNDELDYRPLVRMGRVTDLSIPEPGRVPHERMLGEIGGEGSAAVVPATPGATDPDQPANPTESAAAVVPIVLHDMDAPADYLLEVFLEPEGGVSTQRGYLRFAAQMADLAGEFLRADRTRMLRAEATVLRDVDGAALRFHSFGGRGQIETALVDAASDVFGFARVGLCVIDRPRTRLVAVSHVETIRHDSEAAEQLRRAASARLDADGVVWSEEESAAKAGEGRLRVAAVAAPSAASAWRLVCLEPTESPVPEVSSREALVRLVRHAELAASRLAAWESIPGGGWLARFVASSASGRRQLAGHRHRRRFVWGLLLATLIGVAIVPIPRIVTAPATLRPTDVQVLCAHRDAVVAAVHVAHGDRVVTDQKLITLRDPDLDERIAALEGRRSVLEQQRARWTEAMLGGTDASGDVGRTRGAGRSSDRIEELVGQQRLAREEIRSVDRQLEIMGRIRESLVLRADRAGQIDGWRLDHRLRGRPLRRGEPLLSVVGKETGWIAEAEVAENRVARLEPNVEATVTLSADPDRVWRASLERIGPAILGSEDGTPANVVRLRVVPADEPIDGERSTGLGSDDGIPAVARFRCGRAPIVSLLFQDTLRSARGWIRSYLHAVPPDMNRETP